jgi:RimJ/RimL family protein N-acetyltransferase
MELRNLTRDDLWLYEAIHCDPTMMAELGGPLPPEGLWQKLQRDVADVEADTVWVLVIVQDEVPGTAAGTVSVWDRDWRGETISEIGWMVLPKFQGKGLGSQAVRIVLDRARSTGRWEVLHAFPAVTNPASNAMCRKLGFTLLEEIDYEYQGRILRCNHWHVNVMSPGGRRDAP